LEDEKATQAAINDVLNAAGLSVEREVPCGRGVIDFVVTVSQPFPPPCRGMRFRHVGIEVKIKGAAREIVRQVRGYAASGDLDAVILVTAKPVHLPPEIAGKPVHVFDIARAWL
jgi:hypothetical protein